MRTEGEPLGDLGVRASLAQELQLARGQGKQSHLRVFALVYVLGFEGQVPGRIPENRMVRTDLCLT